MNPDRQNQHEFANCEIKITFSSIDSQGSIYGEVQIQKDKTNLRLFQRSHIEELCSGSGKLHLKKL